MFKCNVGTRQGCILSPFLFSMYMNEFISMPHKNSCSGIYINEDAPNVMTSLMYAVILPNAPTPVVPYNLC